MNTALRQLRRGQIIAAARQIVAEKGLDALTIGTLERAVDFSRGVITYHFKDKGEIVEAVLVSAVEEIDAATEAMVGAGGSPKDKIRAAIRANVHGFVVERAEAGRILLSFSGQFGADAKLRAHSARLYARYRAQSRALVQEGQRAGVFGAANPDAIATILVGSVIGIATQFHFDPENVDVDAAIDVAAESIIARLSN